MRVYVFKLFDFFNCSLATPLPLLSLPFSLFFLSFFFLRILTPYISSQPQHNRYNHNDNNDDRNQAVSYQVTHHIAHVQTTTPSVSQSVTRHTGRETLTPHTSLQPVPPSPTYQPNKPKLQELRTKKNYASLHPDVLLRPRRRPRRRRGHACPGRNSNLHLWVSPPPL